MHIYSHMWTALGNGRQFKSGQPSLCPCIDTKFRVKEGENERDCLINFHWAHYSLDADASRKMKKGQWAMSKQHSLSVKSALSGVHWATVPPLSSRTLADERTIDVCAHTHTRLTFSQLFETWCKESLGKPTTWEMSRSRRRRGGRQLQWHGLQWSLINGQLIVPHPLQWQRQLKKAMSIH